MGLFDTPKPKVTEKEFHKEVLTGLHSKGLTKHKRDKVEMMFQGDFEAEHSSWHSGIDKKEIESRMKWARKNHSKHGLSDKDLDTVESELRKHL